MPSATIPRMWTRSWGRSAPAPSIWISVITASPKMAKTFRGYGTAADRGRQLFSCLSRFVDAGTRWNPRLAGGWRSYFVIVHGS
jgi:hypothetical protein